MQTKRRASTVLSSPLEEPRRDRLFFNMAESQAKALVKRPKRRRTRSHNSSPSPGRGFVIPGFGQDAAQTMSLRDVMDAAQGITNMYLAHEIAVDKDFMIQDLKAPESDLEKQVKEVVHKAFWDLLRDQLAEDPPVYAQALNLLKEVKTGLLGLLVPQQKRVIENIHEKLDLELIAQQAENGALDFQAYASYVINLMGQLCAPVRDEEIVQLREAKEIIPLFQGILKTVDVMKVDMANFHIQQARPLIMNQSVDYERTKFTEFVAKQDDGLKNTREWLKRHEPRDEESQDPKYKKLVMTRIMTEAYLELLEWDEYYVMPETLVMDQKRIFALRDQTERTTVSTATILLTFSNINAFIVPVDAQKVKETIKKHVDILLEDFCDDTDLLKILPNVSVQVVKDVNDYLADKEKQPLPEATVKTLTEQIGEMEDPNHRIRDLVQRRIIEFNKQALSASRSAPLQVPPGLTLCQRELGAIAGNFVRLVNYNRAVFGEFYAEIIENHVLFTETNSGSAAGTSES
eukprot:maker-scaffold924_size80766-snap-gene-0.15 protein:Tk12430 transcript:maker-scaffold924_size80766-snap-gene-0.15-mRNA-1 annotation:"t-complex protein 11-like protein 1-like"